MYVLNFDVIFVKSTAIGGATWTARALQAAYDDGWTPNMLNDRMKLTMVFSDGEASPGQEPCQVTITQILCFIFR